MCLPQSFSGYSLFHPASSAAVSGCDYWSSGHLLWEVKGGSLGERVGGEIWGGRRNRANCRTRHHSPFPTATSVARDRACVLDGRIGGGFHWPVCSSGVSWAPPANFLVHHASFPLLLSLKCSLLFSWIFLFRGCFYSSIKAAFLFPKALLVWPYRDICSWPFRTFFSAQLHNCQLSPGCLKPSEA